MNADLSIHRMAFREADSLGVAQALVVKKRQDLELRLLREQVGAREQTAGAGIDSALRRMQDVSQGLMVDKTA
jgi:hypothetical protein